MSSREPDDIILALDPGPTRTAWLLLVPAGAGGHSLEPRRHGILPNRDLLERLREGSPELSAYYPPAVTVIEKVEGFGMAVGAEVFETVWWSGRFAEASRRMPVERLTRKAVKLHLCGSMRAKDPNIRQALIDRYGGADAIGRKASPGPLYGVAGDVWSALAVAVTWADGVR